MTIDKSSFRLNKTQSGSAPKKRIVLHFTAGSSVAGAVSWWNAGNEKRSWAMGTPYVISRQAVVYETFDHRKAWAYGLGINNAAVEMSSIQIELVNWGPLVQTAIGCNPKDYPTVSLPIGDAISTPEYRGYKLFQRFPAEQVQATAQLVKALCTEHNIPAIVPPEDKRGVCDLAWATTWAGICDHTNFLKAGKWDMGPAWDWNAFAREIQQ